MRCYASWGKVSQAQSRDAYVYRSLLNTMSTSRRRRWWGERPTLELPEGGNDGLGSVDDADQVIRALRGLSPANRSAVVLRYYAELSEAEIADALGVAQGTVKSRLARGLAQLSAALAEPENDRR
jgi:RNA polymerase sigma factor (sigma-70 family)